MTSHEKLAVELVINGKNTTWYEYGKLFGLSEDACHRVWKKVQQNPSWVQECLKKDEQQEQERIAILTKANKFQPIKGLKVTKKIKDISEEDLNKFIYPLTPDQCFKVDDLESDKIHIPTLEAFEMAFKDKHIQKANEVIKDNYIADLEAEIIAYEEDRKNGSAIKTVAVTDEITSLEDLIKVCKIDTTKWNIDKYIQNFWGGKYQVKAFMSLIKPESNLQAQKDVLISQLKDQLAIDPWWQHRYIHQNEKESANQLLELAVFDLHLGKMSWKGETGEDYDLKIAAQRYRDCIFELVNRVNMSKVERILLPLGNDMIHIDNKFKTTTNGTPQDTDGRFAKIIKEARALIIDTVAFLLNQYHTKIDIVIVPGNHDQTVMFTLGEILDAYYTDHRSVKVYNNPKLRKYYQFGKNMIMFTHGSEEKHADLGLIAATEEPVMWANTKYREVHLGHLHKSKSIKYTNVDEYQGFKIRIINSLSGTDAWHYSKGYMSLKGAEAFVWDKEKGLVSNHFYNL